MFRPNVRMLFPPYAGVAVYFWTSVSSAIEDAGTASLMTRREDGIMHVFMLFLGLMLVSIGCSSGNASRDAQPDVRKGR